MCYGAIKFEQQSEIEAYNTFVLGNKKPTGEIAHFQSMSPPTFLATNAPTTEFSVATNQEAVIVKLNTAQGFGYLDWGFNGKSDIFFHHSQLAMPFSELITGQVMRFDVVFNKTSGKNIAKNLVAVGFPKVNSTIGPYVGDFQSMQTAKFTSSAVEPTAIVNKLNVEGTIVEISENHGFIDCDHKLIFFHYNQLCGTIMSELTPGMNVNFNKMFNNVSNRLVAHSVKIATTGHFIDHENATFTSAAVEPVTIVKNFNVEGTIVEITENYGLIDCDHELIFFFYNQLCGSVMSELKPGMTVNFNKMFNNVSKRLIAHSVKIVSTGHFLDCHQTAAAVPQTTQLKGLLKGKISKINSDHGFIKTEDGSNMFFHYSQILSTVLNHLKIDQPVTFTRVFNETSKKFIAHNVAPRTVSESAALTLVKDTLRIEANNLIRRLSGVIMNDVDETENVEIVNVLAPPVLMERVRKDSSVSDLFLTPKSDRSSRRGSIVSFNRKL